MSLILEALKKSEAHRRLGNAPDLSTPFATAKPRRGLLPYIIIAIAIVGAAAWWMLHKPATPGVPATTTTPAQRAPTQQTAAAVAVAQHSISGAAHGSRNDANAPTQEPPIWVAAQRPEASQDWRQDRQARRAARLAQSASVPAYASTPSMGQARAPTSTATPSRPAAHPLNSAPQSSSQWVARGRPNPMPARHPAQAIARSTPTKGNPDSTPQPSSVASSVKPAPASAPAIEQQPRDNSNQVDPTRMVAGPSSVPTKSVLPAEPATAPTDVPPYYQLAYDVRKALPPLKLSMHVYSADPSTRFVILNDSRMTEGEKTPDDVTLEKIVPDGVILQFQGHRFFYPRDAL